MGWFQGDLSDLEVILKNDFGWFIKSQLLGDGPSNPKDLKNWIGDDFKVYSACAYWKFFLSAEIFFEWKRGLTIANLPIEEMGNQGGNVKVIHAPPLNLKKGKNWYHAISTIFFYRIWCNYLTTFNLAKKICFYYFQFGDLGIWSHSNRGSK